MSQSNSINKALDQVISYDKKSKMLPPLKNVISPNSKNSLNHSFNMDLIEGKGKNFSIKSHRKDNMNSTILNKPRHTL
mgnify:CR=1 FL=1